jgi:hypothetical protein
LNADTSDKQFETLTGDWKTDKFVTYDKIITTANVKIFLEQLKTKMSNAPYKDKFDEAKITRAITAITDNNNKAKTDLKIVVDGGVIKIKDKG